MSKSLLSFCFGLIVLVSSCGSEATEGISSDVINNPATASGEEENENVPVIEFFEEIYDFGTIVQGEVITHSYKFKNTGRSDLVISIAKGSCGCTVPEWPQEPIAPGEESAIEVVFDSKNKDGKQHKTITNSENTLPGTSVVALSGMVVAPKK